MSTSDTKTSNVNSALAHLADVVDSVTMRLRLGMPIQKTSYTTLLFF